MMLPSHNRDAARAPGALGANGHGDGRANGRGDAAEPRHAAPAPRRWAIVELFGHARIAGAISEQAFGGAALVRVDVPEVRHLEEAYIDGQRHDVERVIPAHTRSLGAASIYSIHWVDEGTATVAAHSIRHMPLRPYSLRTVLAAMPEGERQRVLALTAGSAVAGGLDSMEDGDAHPF